MLDKLVESKNNGGENKRLSGFLLTTFLTIASILTFGLIYSLFSQNLAMSGEDLDISALAAPITIAEQAPSLQPEPKQNQQSVEKMSSSVPTRTVNMQRPDESPVKIPDSVSVMQNRNQARPNNYFTINRQGDSDPSASSVYAGREGSGDKTGLSSTVKPEEVSEQLETEKPPVIKQAVKPVVEKSKVPFRAV